MKNTREIALEYRLSHWAQKMRERQESGLSIKEYCEREGIHQNVYHYWQRKLRESAVPNTTTAKLDDFLPWGDIIPASCRIPKGDS